MSIGNEIILLKSSWKSWYERFVHLIERNFHQGDCWQFESNNWMKSIL
jgi:hypothetical protein